MLEIKTNQLKTRKKVLIDGNEFTVRKMGNLEQLELSQSMRRVGQLAKIEQSGIELNAKQIAELDELSKKMTEMFIGLFDDGGDQSKSKKMLTSLSDSEIGIILTQIFEEKDGEKDSNKPA